MPDTVPVSFTEHGNAPIQYSDGGATDMSREDYLRISMKVIG